VTDVAGASDLAGEETARKVADYGKVARSARIFDLRLVSARFEVKPEYALAGEQASSNNNFTWVHTPLAYQADAKALSGFFTWKVEVKKGRKRTLFAEARYLVTYDNVPDVDERAAFAFLENVGKFATYPYFRAYVAQMSWNSNANLPILPVLRERQDAIRREKVSG
jgi:hypothetical protein